MSLRQQEIITAALLGLALVLVIKLYWPGMTGMFLVDDTWNLAALNQYGGVTDWQTFKAFVFGNVSGPLGRPVAMLSFLLNDQYYPGSIESYRFTNLMIHCLCGLLLFLLVYRVLSILHVTHSLVLSVALLSSVWWMIAPINVSTTLYVVQRMTQLSTLFSLLGLLVYLSGREQLRLGSIKGALSVFCGLYLIGGIATLSKEVGALIFVYALVLEWIFWSQGRKSHPIIWVLIGFPLVVGVVYAVARWSNSVSIVRDFTVYERLLTESRVLWDYLLKIIFPISGKMGLTQDDFVVSRGLLEPMSTFFSLLAHIGVLVMSWVYRKKIPVACLAVCWFYVGHSMESTIIPLEIYFEHRNYMPSMMVLVGVTFFLLKSGRYLFLRRLSLVVVLIASAFVLSQRVHLWGEPFSLFKVWSVEHPDSIRAQSMQSRALFKLRKDTEAYEMLMLMREKWPQYVHIDILLLNKACENRIDINFPVSEVLAKLDGGYFEGSMPSLLENMNLMYRDEKCPDLFTNSLMHGIFGRVSELKYVNRAVNAKSAMYDLDVYVNEGDLPGAMATLDKALRYQKVAVIPYTKAALLVSAGLYQLALKEVELAIEFERKKPVFKRVDLGRYIALKDKLQKKLIQVDKVVN